MSGSAAVYLAEFERRKLIKKHMVWFDGIPREFQDAFHNSQGFRYGSLPESKVETEKK